MSGRSGISRSKASSAASSSSRAQTAIVIVNLQRAHAGSDVDDARQTRGAQFALKQMHAQPQAKIEHAVAVLDQQVFVAIGAVDRCRLPCLHPHDGVSRIAGSRSPDAGSCGQAALQRFHGSIHRSLERFGLLQSEAAKSHRIAGLELAQLPTLGLHNHRGANESAQAWSVRAKQNRHVAGEVDGADGIRVVVDVRWMQSRLAAILARPLRLGPHQANAGAVRLVVDTPIGAEQHLDIVSSEELRRRVRTIEHADLPMLGHRRESVRREA